MTETQPQDQPLPAVRIRRARRGDIPALVSLFRAHLEYHAALDPRYEPASDARLTEFFHERLREPDTLILLAESGSAGASPSQGAAIEWGGEVAPPPSHTTGRAVTHPAVRHPSRIR
jgi:hypothetical protein